MVHHELISRCPTKLTLCSVGVCIDNKSHLVQASSGTNVTVKTEKKTMLKINTKKTTNSQSCHNRDLQVVILIPYVIILDYIKECVGLEFFINR